MTVSAIRPWRKAFRLERRLPSAVRGPVLLLAFFRLAANCFSVVITIIRRSWLQELHQDGFAPKTVSQLRVDRDLVSSTKQLHFLPDAVADDGHDKAAR